MFEKVDARTHFPTEEEKVLAFWKEERIFEKSLENREGAPEFVFYDGPPFATGLPHYGHLLAGAIKDVIPRYQTMTGHYVDRVFGWDCHGLPVENEVEKSLNINSKHEIEEFGVDKFNESCRSIVLKYTKEWEQVVNRMGRWVDFERGYRTMDRDYMESIWWVFKQLWDKKLVYEGHKIMWCCPRCATPLSNFEVNQGYKEVQDPAITVRFAVNGDANRYLLAWTTTPWTLPGNMALSVGPDIDYVEIADGDDRLIMAEARVAAYYKKEQPEIVARLKGAELVGLTYSPLFDYFADQSTEGAFRVIAADFVTTDAGTGIVHTAPGFGEDDAAAGKANGIPAVCPLNEEGCYTEDVTDYQGRFVKECDADISRRLKEEGKLVHRGVIVHDYPHCWRCDSALLNMAVSTWFVNVESIKDKMLAANSQIRWVPDHIKDGRFGKWLENARDWAISRNRYWGCPLPIWRNKESGEIEVFGSVAELEARSGQKIDDIHKHFVDEITLDHADGTLTRVPEVLDCWFESGSMPYAQRHYPFSNKGWLENNFPADFVAEGLDQTRGWFYTLVTLGAALFDKPAFKNVIVNGMILASDGKKMSKRLKNYPDPSYIMETYGADAMRLYMLSSPVVRGDEFKFSEKRTDSTPDGVRETMSSVLLPIWNAYNFFITYAVVDEWDPTSDTGKDADRSEMDRWVLSSLNSMVADVREAMDNYELQQAASRFTSFAEDLTNWYIRLSRRRFWKSDNDGDKYAAYRTLHEVLLTFCKTAAPFVPFMTETMYRNLRTPQMPKSVHLCDFPTPKSQSQDPILERRMSRAMIAVSLGRKLRKQAEARTRQPLATAWLVSMEDDARDDLQAMSALITDELNVKEVRIEADEERLVTLSAHPNFRRLGAKLRGDMKHAAGAIAGLTSDQLKALRNNETISLTMPSGNVVELTSEDIEIRRTEREGVAVANEGDVTVALDLELTQELRDEGRARELVSIVQNLRKQQELEVTDRITLTVFGDAVLQRVLDAHGSYVTTEILAETIERKDLSNESVNFDLGDCEIAVELHRFTG